MKQPSTAVIWIFDVKDISDIFNDLMGELLWKELIQLKSSDPGKNTEKEKGNFQIKVQHVKHVQHAQYVKHIHHVQHLQNVQQVQHVLIFKNMSLVPYCV